LTIKKCLTRSAVNFVLCASALFAVGANATPITWTIQNATFSDGASAVGTFVIESANGILQDWNITTTAGAALTGFHYTKASSYLLAMNVFNPNSFVLNRTNPFAQPYMNLQFVSSLTAPGTVDIVANDGTASNGSWECNNCTPRRNFVSGFVTTAEVPEPATFGLLAIGAAALVNRRRKTKNLA
jgi:hypothetical protein